MPARYLLCGTSVERGALSRGRLYMVFAPLFPLSEQGFFVFTGRNDMSYTILVTGGARSGKSRFAENLALSHGGPLCYLATAQAYDNEMTERIVRHRSRRGAVWQTIEEPFLLPQTLARIDGEHRAILVDCLTIWISNLLLSLDDSKPDAEEQVLNHLHRLSATLREMSTPVILVTNEVGMGIVPENRLARLFRDIAGQANQILAAAADEVHVVISGIPLQLKGRK